MTLSESFLTNLRQAIGTRTRAEMCRLVKMSDTHYDKIMRGTTKLTLRMVERFCAALHVDPIAMLESWEEEC